MTTVDGRAREGELETVFESVFETRFPFPGAPAFAKALKMKIEGSHHFFGPIKGQVHVGLRGHFADIMVQKTTELQKPFAARVGQGGLLDGEYQIVAVVPDVSPGPLSQVTVEVVASRYEKKNTHTQRSRTQRSEPRKAP